MHEVNVAKQIIEKVGDNVKSIRISVGELCDFFPEEIKETLESMTGWNVDVVEEESFVECSCGYKGKAKIIEREHGFVLFSCPKCNKKPKVLKGDGVKVISVERY